MIITKEKDDKSRRKTDFPRLILEEEDVDLEGETTVQTKKLSTREIVTFLLFCGTFIVAVYL